MCGRGGLDKIACATLANTFSFLSVFVASVVASAAKRSGRRSAWRARPAFETSHEKKRGGGMRDGVCVTDLLSLVCGVCAAR